MPMAGFIACAGTRTVYGMLACAGLARVWLHDRAHAFFARRRWSASTSARPWHGLVADLSAWPWSVLFNPLQDAALLRGWVDIPERGARSRQEVLRSVN